MQNPRLSILRHILGALAANAGPALASAQPADGRSGLAETLQFQIEVRQHERLVRVRTAEGAALAPFVSDGCSGGLSSGWAFFSSTFPALAEKHGIHPPWESCCLDHDRLYHGGGAPDANAEQSYEARLAADEALRICVVEVGARRRSELAAAYGFSSRQVELLYSAVAEVMYRAVRLGGGPCSGLPWRWGFGWPPCATPAAPDASMNDD